MRKLYILSVVAIAATFAALASEPADLLPVVSTLQDRAMDAECALAPRLAGMYRQHCMEAAAISNVAAQTYSGAAKTPTPGVVLGGVTLTPGTDFVFSYTNNVNAGNATLTITAAKVGYFGSRSMTFRVVPADIAEAAFAPLSASTNRTPEVATLTLGGTTLSNGVDYVLSYSYAGATNVTAHGIGNYTGTASTNFVINAAQ
jgi:hypothetical protein